MGGVARKRFDSRPHFYPLAHYRYPVRTVLQNPPQGARRLVAHHQKSVPGIRKIAPLVVQNAPARRHAGAGDDNFRRRHFVNAFRFFRRPRHFQKRKIEQIVAGFYPRVRFFIKISLVFFVDRGRTYGQGRVQKHRDSRNAPRLHKIVYFKQELLGALERKGRHHNHPAPPHDVFDKPLQLELPPRAVLVDARTVGGFHQQKIGVAHFFGIIQKRRGRVANVARTHGSLPVLQ